MSPFLFVFFLSVLAFGHAYYILGFNAAPNWAGTTYPYGIITAFKVGVGNWNYGGFPSATGDNVFVTLLWFLNSLISLVILLNLVVALLGDTYDRVNESASKVIL